MAGQEASYDWVLKTGFGEGVLRPLHVNYPRDPGSSRGFSRALENLGEVWAVFESFGQALGKSGEPLEALGEPWGGLVESLRALRGPGSSRGRDRNASLQPLRSSWHSFVTFCIRRLAASIFAASRPPYSPPRGLHICRLAASSKNPNSMSRCSSYTSHNKGAR